MQAIERIEETRRRGKKTKRKKDTYIYPGRQVNGKNGVLMR